MSRPRSDQRRTGILDAATRVIASRGLGAAATAAIAKEAGVSNGSLFLYFESKSTLLNELYVRLKTEVGDAAMADMPDQGSTRDLVRHMWKRWLRWATSNPEKRRTLAQLEVTDEISLESHELVRDGQRLMSELIERSRAGGPMKDEPVSFVLLVVGAIADTTMDVMIRDPDGADARSDAAFEAMWRVLAG